MISLLAVQLLAVVATALVLGLPGWSITRLLELDRHVPPAMLPAAWFTFGLATWTVALAVTLAARQPWQVTLGAHAVLSLALWAWSRVREHRRGHAKSDWEALNRWTIAGIALSVLLAAGLRTRLAFDTLFHLGLARRMLGLDEPSFTNLDRIAGLGVNPAYAVPSWQALLASVAGVTHLDPATVLESLATLSVLVAASAAAGLGRVVSGSVAGEVAAVAGYGWLRVWFPRRELEGDGVAYAAIPGNLTLDVFLPVALVAATLLLTGRRTGRRSLAVLAGTAVALLVIIHANYVVYVAIIGVGTVAWMAIIGPWTSDVRRGARWATLALLVPSGIAFLALLPLLVLLDHFGQPMEQRIDYHLLGSGALRIIRPGHLYDSYGAAGMLAVVALPWAAWRARGTARALVAGGSFAILAVSLVPPLRAALHATGSLTLELRLSRPFGVLLVAVIAIVLPDLAAAVARLAARTRTQRGRWSAWGIYALPLLGVALAAWIYGYPQARHRPMELGPSWPTIVGAVGLLGVTVVLARHRTRRSTGPEDVPAAFVASPRLVGLTALAVGVCLLPSGFISVRRGAWQSRQVVASVRADDLGCGAGIQEALSKVPAGEVVLADPVTGYLVQALGPVRIAADFKVWNGSTDVGRIKRRIDLLEVTFDSLTRARAVDGLRQLASEFDARWVVVSTGNVRVPDDSGLDHHDAVGLRAALAEGVDGARLLAAGPGLLGKDPKDDEIVACDLQLWRLDGAELGDER